MPLGDLFEEATPELISGEASRETEAEFRNQELNVDLTPDVLIERGVTRLMSVSVGTEYAGALAEFAESQLAESQDA